MNVYLENNFQKQFNDSLEILKLLNKNGHEAYFVGGCVRDYYLNKPFYDIDITTSATPEEIKKIFPYTLDTGIKHGTVTVGFKKKYYEVTTFRSESDYVMHRFPKRVEYITNLSEDLKRRDFTINSMAMTIDEELIDLHYGLNDLKNNIIRTVNEANERFNEDALRMLRAFRFASQLNFDIEEETFKAIKNNAHLLGYISIERIVSELEKLFSGVGNKKAFELLMQSNLNNFIPLIDKVEIIRDYSTFSFSQVIFIMLYDNNISLDNVKNLKLSNKNINRIKKYFSIISNIQNTSIKELCYRYEIDDLHFINSLLNFTNNKNITVDNLIIKNAKDINIKIQDIINLYPNKKAGPWIKNIFSKIESEIINGKLDNSRKSIEIFIYREVEHNE